MRNEVTVSIHTFSLCISSFWYGWINHCIENVHVKFLKKSADFVMIFIRK